MLMMTYDQRRSELRGESTARILAAAVCLFGQNGYEKTSVKDIADMAEVSMALVFKYFESKENLLSAAYIYANTETYPVPGKELVLREWFERLIKQSIEAMKTKPEIFDFFMMMLCTSDLPESYHRTRREYFFTAPIYPAMEKWQKLRKLPDGSLFDYFITFMRTVYMVLDFYRKMDNLRDCTPINAGVLLSYIVDEIKADI